MQDDTDLPLPLRGRSGNHADAAEQALEVLTAAGISLEEIVDLVTGATPAPPLHTTDRGEVMRWLQLASDRIIDFETGRRVRRGVLEILDAQFHLEHHARRHAERIAAQAERHAAKAAGTYWRERDARRATRRPIHVEVDPEAWAAMKLDTIRTRTTVGEAVGVLIQSDVERRHQAHGEMDGEIPADWSDRRGQPGVGRRANLFARIVVDDETWADFKALAAEAGLTAARAVGLLVEGRDG